jgi:hypothetical protein
MIFGQALQVGGDNRFADVGLMLQPGDRSSFVFATGHRLAPHKSNASDDWLLFDPIAGQLILQK